MIDLETLSTKSNAMILTIGAVEFIPETGLVKKRFYKRIDLESYDENKVLFDMDPKTLIWWMQQNETAKKEAFIITPRYNILSLLKDFVMWLEKIKNQKIIPWSHGKDFDIVILQTHFNIFNIKCPWNYWDSRDTRTIYDFMSIDMKKISIPEYVEHHAIGDCLKQIEGIKQAHKKMKNLLNKSNIKN